MKGRPARNNTGSDRAGDRREDPSAVTTDTPSGPGGKRHGFGPPCAASDLHRYASEGNRAFLRVHEGQATLGARFERLIDR